MLYKIMRMRPREDFYIIEVGETPMEFFYTMPDLQAVWQKAIVNGVPGGVTLRSVRCIKSEEFKPYEPISSSNFLYRRLEILEVYTAIRKKG